MPFGHPGTEMARYMLKHGNKMMKMEKKFFKKEHIDPHTFEERSCALSSCSNVATKKCSRCRAAYYCSTECNVANWKVHKRDCNKVEKEECNAPKEKPKTKKDQLKKEKRGKSTTKTDEAEVNSKKKDQLKKEKRGKSTTKTDEAEVNSKKKTDEHISDEQAHKNMVRALRSVFPETKVVNKRGQEYPKNY